MEIVQLGRTGVEVSRIGFGGAPAGQTNYLQVPHRGCIPNITLPDNRVKPTIAREKIRLNQVASSGS